MWKVVEWSIHKSVLPWPWVQFQAYAYYCVSGVSSEVEFLKLDTIQGHPRTVAIHVSVVSFNVYQCFNGNQKPQKGGEWVPASPDGPPPPGAGVGQKAVPALKKRLPPPRFQPPLPCGLTKAWLGVSLMLPSFLPPSCPF